MSGKPYLQLELDEHSADAGMITRVEAFLDSLRFYEYKSPIYEYSPIDKSFSPENKVIYIPNMCDHAYAVKAAFNRCGITAEVFALVEKAGISKKVFYDTVAGSGAATVSGLFKECGKKVVGDDYDPVFPIDLLCKDAGLGIQMARDLGSTPVIASCVQVLNEIAKGNGYGGLDTAALVKVYEDLYGMNRKS